MYRMGMMSLLASDCDVDSTRCMKMALVHDVAEAIVGDITPHCSVSDEDKFSLESQAVQKIKDMLGQHTQAGGPTWLGVAQLVAWQRWACMITCQVQAGRRTQTCLKVEQCSMALAGHVLCGCGGSFI